MQSTDDGVGGTSISYSFATNGNPGNLFSINQTTGQITFTGSAQDYETNAHILSDANGKYFRVMVQASDGTLTSSATEVKVYLNNVNEAPSRIWLGAVNNTEVNISGERRSRHESRHSDR